MIFPLNQIELTLATDTRWSFEQENEEAIRQHWEQETQKNPHLWNGRMLKLTSYDFNDGIFNGTCHETSFAAYLAWRDWQSEGYNIFGSTILRSEERALLYGVMGSQTANAGKIYPPGGYLDPADIGSDGKIDVIAALERELAEETGLRFSDGTPGAFFLAFDKPNLCVARVLDIPLPADEIRTRIIAHSRASEEQELSDVMILRQSSDYPQNGPAYAHAFACHFLDETLL